jgi:hypothetical protein
VIFFFFFFFFFFEKNSFVAQKKEWSQVMEASMDGGLKDDKSYIGKAIPGEMGKKKN